MKLSFDTVGAMVSSERHSPENLREMDDAIVASAYQACLHVRRLLGEAGGYVEVLKVRFFYSADWSADSSCHSIRTTVKNSWFKITAVVAFGDDKRDTGEQGIGNPPLYGDDPEKCAQRVVSDIRYALGRILESNTSQLSKLRTSFEAIR